MSWPMKHFWKPSNRINACIPWDKLRGLSRAELLLVKETLSVAAKNENIRHAKQRFIDTEIEQEPDHIDSVIVIAFDKHNKLLALQKKSKVSLPTGHVEWDDSDAEAAARREVLETTGLSLGPLLISNIIENNNKNDSVGSVIVFTGYINEETITENNGFSLLKEEAFLTHCTGGVCTNRRIICAAKDALSINHDETSENQQRK